MAEVSGWEGWAILELMGHRRLAGYLSEQTIGGSSFLRLDIPGEEGKPAVTQFYSGGSVYCITPCDEETAKAVAASLTERGPISRYELRELLPPKRRCSSCGRALPDGDPGPLCGMCEAEGEDGEEEPHTVDQVPF